jgi:hypothetical protein
LYFEVGFAGHKLHTGGYADAVSYADAVIVVANIVKSGPAAQARRSARGFRSGQKLPGGRDRSVSGRGTSRCVLDLCG